MAGLSGFFALSQSRAQGMRSADADLERMVGAAVAIEAETGEPVARGCRKLSPVSTGCSCGRILW
jgi:hypothetical protein